MACYIAYSALHLLHLGRNLCRLCSLTRAKLLETIPKKKSGHCVGDIQFTRFYCDESTWELLYIQNTFNDSAQIAYFIIKSSACCFKSNIVSTFACSVWPSSQSKCEKESVTIEAHTIRQLKDRTNHAINHDYLLQCGLNQKYRWRQHVQRRFAFDRVAINLCGKCKSMQWI